MTDSAVPETPPPLSTAKRAESLAGTGATDEEIAVQMGLSVNTLRRKYSRAIERARTGFKLRLRYRQANLALAEDGSERMLLWLGRQHLGQNERSAETDPAAQPATFGKVYLDTNLSDV